MSEIKQEIIEALQMKPEDLPPAQPLDPADSPLNYPVKEKDIAGGGDFKQQAPPPGDAPEQQIGGEGDGQFDVPSAQTLAFADFILDAANNIIEVGAGFFIKIKKHDEFYAYEELIQVIDEQNTKNVRRLMLNEMDKAMLRPLLALVLRSRAKVLTPEQQLLVALFSILIKKAQVVMEVRAENQILTERIKGIIQEENSRQQEPDVSREAEPQMQAQMEPQNHVREDSPLVAESRQEDNGVHPPNTKPTPGTIPISSIVDIAEEEPESPFPKDHGHSITKHEKPDS